MPSTPPAPAATSALVVLVPPERLAARYRLLNEARLLQGPGIQGALCRALDDSLMDIQRLLETSSSATVALDLKSEPARQC